MLPFNRRSVLKSRDARPHFAINLRWQDEGVFCAHAVFLPIAEKTGKPTGVPADYAAISTYFSVDIPCRRGIIFFRQYEKANLSHLQNIA